MPPLSRVSARAVRHRSVPRPPRHTRKANNGTVAELPFQPEPYRGASRSPRTERPPAEALEVYGESRRRSRAKAAPLPKVTRTPRPRGTVPRGSA